MIDKLFETFITAIVTIIIMGGVGFITWWAGETLRINCFKGDCCKKKYKWKCKNCGCTLKSDTQPYCKTCIHVERINIKMDKQENK